MSRDTSVGLIPGRGKIILVSGAHTGSHPMGIWGSFSGGKADHSPPPSAEVKNGEAIPPFTHTSSWRGA
jgi:hypothetical protein